MNVLQKLSGREIRSEISVEKFEVLDFYGSPSIFLWKGDKLLIVPHQENSDDDIEVIDPSPLKPRIVASPKPIKTVCSYSGRVFIVCEPAGIFKLSKSLKFLVLSETGIGLGCGFHQVLSPTKDWLYLADKYTKKSTPLFQFPEGLNSVIHRVVNNSPDDFESSCLIAAGKKLYRLTGEAIEILHIENSDITEILVFQKGRSDFGVGLITVDNYLVLLLPQVDDNKTLKASKKVYYDGNISTLTLQCLPGSSAISAFHSNGHNIYHRKINIDVPSDRSTNIDVVFTHDGTINCLKTRNDRILTLANERQLMEFITTKTMGQTGEKREYHSLREDMIKNTNIIVERICERARELEAINREISISQRRLEGVNAYAHNQRTQFSPTIKILRRSGQNFLEVKLEALPEGSRVFVNVKMGEQRVFGSRVVEDRVTSLEIPLEVKDFDIEKFDVRIDLVAGECEGRLWCILNNYSRKGQDGGTRDREKFLQAKAATLRSLMDKGCLDDVKLRYIKRSIRKD